MSATAASPAEAGYNRMAILSLTCAVVAVAGFFFGGFTSLAVFAVGAGHVALNQINSDGGQGRQLARVSLAVGYAIAIFGLLITVMSVLGLYT
ncbi:hypothetical protein ASF98_15945 [Arthrobacter sp. Leaf337]|jgi:hypothetical protein|uniref:DUF4190 domain-containing protein n=1 Tax=unclassified Arthrobacter TaxID=235627 RepID=UPI0006FC72A1|nr:DUF4190 domain-containing protein [Arthrobacter sp. Leaf337]KQR81917.1 hypothetical protein ASF98_15945 [Arthrobacter sp. Leaf337]